ncbi:hypothetical protein SCHPADRAFT_200109 [Schizopora paradoxa]|uniref:TPR-like protein n=1 Tax=Schizopora paradoxa TaxID=27342 RepID=A0A0H2S530_9AGAM|nr:hypothetical protein SCHPADRAFT_200109 [Schizopora paradoxa]
MKDPKRIEDMEKELARVVSLFSLDADIQLGQDISRTVQDVKSILSELHGIREAVGRVEDQTAQVHADVKTGIHVANLARLPYAYNATWNPSKICLSGTRQNILEEIKTWVLAPSTNDGAQIFWLTSVPGAGKSTIAHSAAKFFAEAGQLGSSFFFSRDDAERGPKLFSTMACDLASKFPHFRSSLSQAIEEDIGLASAGLIRHFQGLVFPFCTKISLEKQLVIVIDALDEGYSKDLVNILTGDFANLPSFFRFFVTSRDVDELKALHHAGHVHHVQLNHLEEWNWKDVDLLTRHLLGNIGKERQLEDWPTEDAMQQLAKKSEGLMIWVVAVCQYLMEVPYPKEDLDDILQDELAGDQGAEAKMDDLYAKILLKYAWRNKRFSEKYHQVMGAILASRVPLSPEAIQILQTSQLDIQNILPYIKPLLQSTPDGATNQPLQLIHKSLQEFLTERALKVPQWEKFAINEKEYSQQLALQCLKVMNIELHEDRNPGIGYLKQPSRDIPNLDNVMISEQLWYACRFWMDHLNDCKFPQEDLLAALKLFLHEKAISWIELTTAKGSLPNILQLTDWIKNCHKESMNDLQTPETVAALSNISVHLLYKGRRQEALNSAKNAVALTVKQLNETEQDFNSRYASSLNHLSIMLSQMGFITEALPIIKEAVCVNRRLSQNDPALYNPELARSLHNLSMRLSQVGEKQGALEAIKEAVQIKREIAQEDGPNFITSLALSLQTMSVTLSELGLYDEALHPIREAVEIQKNLGLQDNTEYDANLASFLNTLSYALMDLNAIDEAVSIIQEAVTIRKNLASQDLQAFNPSLADSLQNLSTVLLRAGSQKEALLFAQEAVEIYQKLAEDNPSVHKTSLAQALQNLALAFYSLRQIEHAASFMKEAVRAFRELADQTPGLYREALAHALSNLSSMILDTQESKDGALSAIQEAVIIFRSLAEDDTISHKLRLAGSLSNMSGCLSMMGLREEAVSPMAEAVEINKCLTEHDSKAYKHEFALALNKLGTKLMETGRYDQALFNLREAVAIQKELSQSNPKAFETELPQSLGTLSTVLMFTGNKEESLESSKETVDLYRALVSKNDSPIHLTKLSESLINLSFKLSDMGLQEEGIACLREAEQASRKVVRGGSNPIPSKGDLAMALKFLSEGLMEAGSRDEALHILKESVSLYREAADQIPSMYIAPLMAGLQVLASVLHEEGDHEKADALIKEANEFQGSSTQS